MTRPLPRRQQAAVPLVRTASHDSDSTTFSWSSIPSNGGFTGFSYPTASSPSAVTNANANVDPTLTLDPTFTPSEQTSYVPSSTVPSTVAPAHLDLSSFLPATLPQLPVENLDSVDLDFEQWLNLNIDALAPPVDDLASNLDAEIQAALRSMDPGAFMNLTLAPSPSTSPTSGVNGHGDGSPVSGFSAGEWVPELSPEEAESMEMLKLYLDGMDFVAPDLEYPSFPPTEAVSSCSPNSAVEPVRTQSPDTVGDISLSSGQTSPQRPIQPFSLDFELPVNLDFDTMDMEVDGRAKGEGSSSAKEEEGWMMGVLPFDMLGETWIEA